MTVILCDRGGWDLTANENVSVASQEALLYSILSEYSDRTLPSNQVKSTVVCVGGHNMWMYPIEIIQFINTRIDHSIEFVMVDIWFHYT